jgi:hypothetical protein
LYRKLTITLRKYRIRDTIRDTTGNEPEKTMIRSGRNTIRQSNLAIENPEPMLGD